VKRLDKLLIIAILVCAILLLIVIINNPIEKSSDPSLDELNLKKGLLDVKWDDDWISIKTKIEKYPNVIPTNIVDTGSIVFKGGNLCGFTVGVWWFSYYNGSKLHLISISFDSKTIENMEAAFVKLRNIVINELGPPIEKQTNHLNKRAEWDVLIDSSKYVHVFLNREIYDWSPNYEGLLLEISLKDIDTSSHIERTEYQSSDILVDTTIFGSLSYGMTVNQVKGLSNIYVAGLSDFNYSYAKVYSMSRRTLFCGDSVKLIIYFDQQGTVERVFITDFSLCNRKTGKGTYLPSITNEGKSEIKRIKGYFTRLYGAPSSKDTNYTEWYSLSTTMWHSSSSDISLLQDITTENHKKMEGEPGLFFERKKKP
jgi:hypothetical protein